MHAGELSDHLNLYFSDFTILFMLQKSSCYISSVMLINVILSSAWHRFRTVSVWVRKLQLIYICVLDFPRSFVCLVSVITRILWLLSLAAENTLWQLVHSNIGSVFVCFCISCTHRKKHSSVLVKKIVLNTLFAPFASEATQHVWECTHTHTCELADFSRRVHLDLLLSPLSSDVTLSPFTPSNLLWHDLWPLSWRR